MALSLKLNALGLIWADTTTEELCFPHHVPVSPNVRAVQSASLPTAYISSLSEGWALADSPDIECGPQRGALPSIFKHSPPRTFLIGPSSPILPLPHFSLPQTFLTVHWLRQPKHPPQADRAGVPCQMSVLLKTKP